LLGSCLFHRRLTLAPRGSWKSSIGFDFRVDDSDRSARVSPHRGDLEMSDLVVSSDGQVLLTCLLPRCTFRERQRRRYIDLSVCRSALELMFTSEKKMLPLRINVKRKLKTKWCWSDWRSVARAFTLARRLDESKASATRRLPFTMARV
jgi:hypothetical protein